MGQWLGIGERHERGDRCSEVSALCSVALVSESTHEEVPQTRAV